MIFQKKVKRAEKEKWRRRQRKRGDRVGEREKESEWLRYKERHRETDMVKNFILIFGKNLKIFDASTIINCEHSCNDCRLKMRVILKEIEK